MDYSTGYLYYFLGKHTSINTILYHSTENTVANTINATYARFTMEHLDVIPSKIQLLFCILIGWIFYGTVLLFTLTLSLTLVFLLLVSRLLQGFAEQYTWFVYSARCSSALGVMPIRINPDSMIFITSETCCRGMTMNQYQVKTCQSRSTSTSFPGIIR